MLSLGSNGLQNFIKDLLTLSITLEVQTVKLLMIVLFDFFFLKKIYELLTRCSKFSFVYLYIWAEATPKSLMRVMGIPGLTLYHLKSHLQASFTFRWIQLIHLCCSWSYGKKKENIFFWVYTHLLSCCRNTDWGRANMWKPALIISKVTEIASDEADIHACVCDWKPICYYYECFLWFEIYITFLCCSCRVQRNSKQQWWARQ